MFCQLFVDFLGLHSGDQSEAVKFLEQLNDNGKEYNLHFTLAETDYEYRIAFDAEGMTASDRFLGGGADAAAAVLNPDCELLFINFDFTSAA